MTTKREAHWSEQTKAQNTEKGMYVGLKKQNKFQLNESKCKELRTSFAKPAADFAPIVINGKAIEVVSTVKLLGLNIFSDLRWNCHVAEISKKSSGSFIFS